MSVLSRICEAKRLHIEKQKQLKPLSVLKEAIRHTPQCRGFIKALKNAATPSIIAEVKKASPAKGIIRTDFDPVKIAKTYAENGAVCLSVLTDEEFFLGKDEYLRQIRDIVALPILRKDFIIDPYQIYESRALGADCILLIIAALNDKELKNLYDTACNLDFDVLIEIHDKEEIDRVLALNPNTEHTAIGINSRNLKTMVVDLQNIINLSSLVPDYFLKIGESGIHERQDIEDLMENDIRHFLIGEHLMRQDNYGEALKRLLSV